MKAFWAVLRLELFKSTMIFMAAFLAGWLPVLAPWVPGTERHLPEDIQAAVLVIVVPAFTLFLIFGLGSSFLVRDLSEQRLSFYLSRPIPGATLWFAKWIGSFLLTLGSILFICLPSMMFLAVFDGFFERNFGIAQSLFWLLIALLALLILLALTHTLALIIRARTVWLLFDLLAVSAIIGCGWLIYDLVISNRVHFEGRALPLALFFWCFIALTIAGCVQTALGRNNLARSHRLISTTLWPPILAVSAGLLFYIVWLVSPSKIEITRLAYIEAAPQGPWLAIGGQLHKRAPYQGTFLFNTESETSIHIGNLDTNFYTVAFSDDGEIAVHRRCHRLWTEPCTLVMFDLTQTEPTAKTLSVEVRSPTTPLVLSEDGNRLAFWDEGTLFVYELPGARLISALQLDKPEDFRFRTADDLWLRPSPHWQDDELHSELKSFHIITKQLTSLGTLPISRIPTYLTAPYGTEVEELNAIPPSAQFHTESIRTQYPPIFPKYHLDRVRRLADGSLLWLRKEPGTFHLVLVSTEGELKREIVYPHPLSRTLLLLGGEIEPGKIVVAVLEGSVDALGHRNPWRSFVVDLETEQWLSIGTRLRPIPYPALHHTGNPASKLFLGPTSLMKLNFEDPENPETLLEFHQPLKTQELYF